MKGLFHTAVAAVITLTLVTAPASSVKAAWQTGSPTLFDVMNVVYCVIGTGSCVGLEPGADLVTPEDGITQADVEAAVADAMPDCDFEGGQVWDGSTCATPEGANPGPNCFLMGLCGQDGAASFGVEGPYSGYTLADAEAGGFQCISSYEDGVGGSPTALQYQAFLHWDNACN